MNTKAYLKWTKIILAAAAVLLLAIFAALIAKEKARQKEAQAQMLDAIDNVVLVCTSYDEKIEIKEDLRSDLDIYAANINGTDSVQEKAYYANIMLTYVQNRVNMNDPKNLYELALELGNAYEADPEQAAAYKKYQEELSAASEQFRAADINYKNS
ncbi:MAG: hypothetical protein IKS17_09185 [Firmicutes bacterium]|nr:hypothetical protein [Bacillota bacterium]